MLNAPHHACNLQDHPHKYRILVAEATRWIGTHEHGGPNHGEIVSLFQHWNKRVHYTPWCMAFIQYCLLRTDWTYDYITECSSRQKHGISPTEHVLTAWENTAHHHRRKHPQAGYIAVWQRYANNKPSPFGHAGIVVQTSTTTPTQFVTVEGNTSMASTNAHGVARKQRTMDGMGCFRVLGFLDPWSCLLSHEGELAWKTAV